MCEIKTIAIFSAYIPPHLGGIERYIDNLTKQFVAMGIKPIIVTSNYNNEKEKEDKDGITIIRLPVFNTFKMRYPIVKIGKKCSAQMKLLEQYKIDAIIVNTRFHLTSHVGANYGKKHHIPVFLIEHGSNYVTLDNRFIDFFANRYEDFLTWRIQKKVLGFYGVSNACGEWLKHFGIHASGTWYNSIDTEQDVPRKVKHEGITFLYAGRLIKQKGVENLLDAFCELEKTYDNIKLLIAGDGSEYNSYVSKYHSDEIQFLGKLDFQQLLDRYAETDVFLYPPLWPEGLPTSILEAGLMKCCVIGTNQGGICEVIENGKNGIIVDTNVNDLENAMQNMITHEDDRNTYAEILFQTINNKFSWRVTAHKIVEDIKEKL